MDWGKFVSSIIITLPFFVDDLRTMSTTGPRIKLSKKIGGLDWMEGVKRAEKLRYVILLFC
jgi:hypothetical protein